MSLSTNTKQTFDAVVIGGGTIGAATAWHLSKAGKQVALIERNTIGSGNTSKAASLMTLVRAKEALIPLIQETYKNIDTIEAATGQSVGKQNVGTLHIAASETSKSNLAHIESIADKHQIKHRKISHEEIRQRVPWLDTASILDASFMEDDAFVDAYVLATGCLQRLPNKKVLW